MAPANATSVSRVSANGLPLRVRRMENGVNTRHICRHVEEWQHYSE